MEPSASTQQIPSTHAPQVWVLVRGVAPLAAYYLADWLWGLRAGIVASALWSMGEVALHLIQRQPLDFIFKVTAITTLVFGAVDLWCTKPWLISYEPVVTNAMGAGLILYLAKGSLEPFLEQVYRARPDLRGDPGVVIRLRLALWILAGLTLVKVPVYLIMALRLPVERAMNLRMVVGYASLGLMFLAVRFGTEPLMALGRRLGWTTET